MSSGLREWCESESRSMACTSGQHGDVRLAAHRGDDGLFDCASCPVCVVDDPWQGVGGFCGEVQFARGTAIERHARGLDEHLADEVWTFVAQQPDRGRVAESCARGDDVGREQFG